MDAKVRKRSKSVQNDGNRWKTVKRSKLGKKSKTVENGRKRWKMVENCENRSKTVEIGQNQWKTVKIDGKRSKSIENGRNQSKTVEISQKRSKSVKTVENGGNQLKTVENSRKQWKSVEIEVDEYYAYFTSSISNKDWNEWYHSGLFVFGLQSKIRKSVEMFNPKSLLDAYHLAKWQESMNDIMRKNSNTSLSSSSKIDHSKEVKEYYIELEFRGDGKGNEAQSSGEEINKFGVKVLKVPYEETVEGIGMKSKGSVELDGKNMEMDGKCLKDIDDFVNKEDKIEENKNEIGIKSRELVDKNMNKVSLDISKDADTGETFSNDIKIDSNDWVACDSNCEESEIFIASNELESHTLVELSKEGNKDDKSALIHVSEDKDYGLVGKFSSDLGVKFDCVGSIFVEASPVVEKPKASVTNIEKDTTYDMLVNWYVSKYTYF
nr:hypothetical protein [Tanacetum cinerariifolium]GEY96359.1 hypothetical protein [Tanacetum cinerariifolium]